MAKNLSGMSETLPKGWQEINLEDIVLYSKGKKPKKLSSRTGIGLIPYINIKAFEKGIINEYADAISSKLINKRNILVVWDGARFGFAGIGMEGAAGSTIMVLTPILIESKYIYHFINRHYSYINSKPKGTGTPHVNPDVFWKIQSPLPPLNEQKRIAAKLDKIIPRIEAVKERLDKVPAIIKRFRQSVLTAAITGKLTEKWRAEHPDVESAEALNRILHEKNTSKDKKYISKSLKSELSLPEIPSTWLWIKLPDSGEFGRGKSKHRPRNAKHLYGGIYPFIQTGDVAQSNGLILNHKQTYSSQGLAQSRLWPAGTICITIAANIADSAILTYPACFPDSIVGIIVNRELYETNFIEYYIRTIKEDISLYAPATAQKNINLSILSEVLVPLPSLEEQKEIVRQVDKLFAVADKLEKHYKNAKAKVDKLSQSVLAKAFRGELVITEAELAEKEGRDFESAEELLKRIQKEKERLAQGTPRTLRKKRNEHEKD